MRTHTDLKTVLMLVVIKSAPCSWRTDALWHSVRRWIIYDVSHHRQTGCNGQTIAGALSLPSRALSSRYLCPSVTHVHSLSICYTHTHTHTRLGRLLSKRNCLQITECFLITVVIPTQCWVSLWLLYRCIWMTLEYRRLNGVSFHFNSTIIVILQERSSIFHLLKDGFINFFSSSLATWSLTRSHFLFSSFFPSGHNQSHFCSVSSHLFHPFSITPLYCLLNLSSDPSYLFLPT